MVVMNNIAFMKQLAAVALLMLIEAVAARRHVVQVTVTNDVGPGINISVHCKSKNDDFGLKVLQYKWMLSFSFRPNIWGTTDYYCYFFQGRTKQAAFDVFTEGMCDHCTWFAQKDFICLLNQPGGSDPPSWGWHFGPPPFKNICQSWIGVNPPATALKANGTSIGDIAG